jgi:Ni/Co efflux regulator RcnB
MRNYLLAASCLALLAPGAGLAQVQTEPGVKPVPNESRPPPRPAPYRPSPPPGAFHPPTVAPGGPYRPGSIYPGVAVRPGPVGPGGIPPHRPVVGVVPATPVPAEPRYGVVRTAPGVATRVDRPRPGAHRIWSENQKHWNWNGHRYHGGPYHYPSGHHYRRWRIGQIVPLIFLQPEYVYDDYADLGFDDPPPGYEWVRYGPDMLLVNLDTGEVVDVEYGVFD